MQIYNIKACSNELMLKFIYYKCNEIFIIITDRGRHCRAGRERWTPYQSEDLCPIIPTHKEKEDKEITVKDKKGARRLI